MKFRDYINSNNRTHSYFSGFTLIEVLITIGLIAILSAISIPLFTGTFSNNKALASVQELDANAFGAQQDAYAAKDSYGYGLYLPDGGSSYTVFVGDSMATAVFTYEILLQDGVTLENVTIAGGGDEVLFGSGDFKPNNSAQLDVDSSTASYAFEISSEGLIQYYKN